MEHSHIDTESVEDDTKPVQISSIEQFEISHKLHYERLNWLYNANCTIQCVEGKQFINDIINDLLNIIDYCSEYEYDHYEFPSDELIAEWKTLSRNKKNLYRVFNRSALIFSFKDCIPQTIEQLPNDSKDIICMNDVLDYVQEINLWENGATNETDTMYTLINQFYEDKYNPTNSDKPKFIVRTVLITGLDDDPKNRNILLCQIQDLLKFQNIFLIHLDEAINYCIKKYDEEFSEVKEISLTTMNKSRSKSFLSVNHSSVNQRVDNTKKRVSKTSKRSKGPGNGSMTINTESKSTKSSVESQFSQPAKLGRIVNELKSSRLPLPDDLLSKIVVTYMGSLNQISGFLLVDYPGTISEIRAIENELTGIDPKWIDSNNYIRNDYNQLIPFQRNTRSDYRTYFNGYYRLIEINPRVNNMRIGEIDKDEFNSIKRFYTEQNIYKEYNYYNLDADFIRSMTIDILSLLCGAKSVASTEVNSTKNDGTDKKFSTIRTSVVTNIAERSVESIEILPLYDEWKLMGNSYIDELKSILPLRQLMWRDLIAYQTYTHKYMNAIIFDDNDDDTLVMKTVNFVDKMTCTLRLDNDCKNYIYHLTMKLRADLYLRYFERLKKNLIERKECMKQKFPASLNVLIENIGLRLLEIELRRFLDTIYIIQRYAIQLIENYPYIDIEESSIPEPKYSDPNDVEYINEIPISIADNSNLYDEISEFFEIQIFDECEIEKYQSDIKSIRKLVFPDEFKESVTTNSIDSKSSINGKKLNENIDIQSVSPISTGRMYGNDAIFVAVGITQQILTSLEKQKEDYMSISPISIEEEKNLSNISDRSTFKSMQSRQSPSNTSKLSYMEKFNFLKTVVNEEIQRFKGKVNLIVRRTESDVDRVTSKVKNLFSIILQKILRRYVQVTTKTDFQNLNFQKAIERHTSFNCSLDYKVETIKSVCAYRSRIITCDDTHMHLAQLIVLKNMLILQSPDGFCPLKTYLQILNELHDKWLHEEGNSIISKENLILSSNSPPWIDWRDLILSKLIFGMPNFDEIKNLLENYKNAAASPEIEIISKNQFFKIPLWFELAAQGRASTNSTTSLDIVDTIKRIIFEMYCTPCKNGFEYTQFLLALCKDKSNGVNGYIRALSLFQEEDFNGDDLIGDEYLNLIKEKHQIDEKCVLTLFDEIIKINQPNNKCEISQNPEYCKDKDKQYLKKSKQQAVEEFLKLKNVYFCGCQRPIRSSSDASEVLSQPPFSDRRFWIDVKPLGHLLIKVFPWHNQYSGNELNLKDGISQAAEQIIKQAEEENNIGHYKCHVLVHRFVNHWHMKHWIEWGFRAIQ